MPTVQCPQCEWKATYKQTGTANRAVVMHERRTHGKSMFGMITMPHEKQHSTNTYGLVGEMLVNGGKLLFEDADRLLIEISKHPQTSSSRAPSTS